jgi:DeoR/GlpR family transcriptional regulator of sugar metabolism
LSADFFLAERHSEILQRLKSAGKVISVDLAREFDVSEDTIRRDLRDLAAAGECVRVYGGALPVHAQDVPLAERLGSNVERKRKLAAKLVSVIEPHSMVFLDAGSTNVAVANCLPHDLDLTIVTHAPHVAAAVCGRAGIRLILIGGKVDEKVGAATGAQSLGELKKVRPDLCFVGACAIDGELGASAFDQDDAEFKRRLLEQSRRSLVGLLSDKIPTRAPYAFAPLSAFDQIVVERDIDPVKLASLNLSSETILRT